MQSYAFIQKWPKYAFAYAHMQMHNYPKPSNEYTWFELTDGLNIYFLLPNM